MATYISFPCLTPKLIKLLIGMLSSKIMSLYLPSKIFTFALGGSVLVITASTASAGFGLIILGCATAFTD